MDKSVGLLVLGMHRSGTSALARVMNLAGADLGARVLGASPGNEAGHWEDAFAVELHERLLAGLGARWDEPFAVPAGFNETDPGKEAAAQIQAYIAQDRMRHPIWAVKDPRLSLFAGLWVEAIQRAGARAGAVVVIRHPMEVAASLAARDGIGLGQANLLWLDYMQAAVSQAEVLPHCVIDYDALLDNRAEVASRINALPEGSALNFESARSEIDGFMSVGHRHHRAENVRMSGLVAEVWGRLSHAARTGKIEAGTGEWIRNELKPIRDLILPYAHEKRLVQRQLWERIARAEAHPGHDEVVEKLSDELAKLQGWSASAVLDFTAANERLEMLRSESGELAARVDSTVRLETSELRSRLDQHSQNLVKLYSDDIRAMQEVVASAREDAGSARREAEIARCVTPMLERLQHTGDKLVEGLVDVRDQLGDEMRAGAASIGSAMAALRDDSRRLGESLVEARHQLGDEMRAGAASIGSTMGLLRDDSRRVEGGLKNLREELAQELREALGSFAGRIEQAGCRVSSRLEGLLDGNRVLNSEVAAIRQMSNEFGASIASIAAMAESEEQVRELQFARLIERIDHSERLRAERDALGMQLHASRSELNQLQREMVSARREQAALEESVAELDAIKRSMSWNVTRPLRVTKRLLTGRWSQADGDKLRRLLHIGVHRAPVSSSVKGRLIEATMPSRGGSPAALPDAELAPLLRLADAQSGTPDVFVWAVIDWRFRTQRPQHLARALAEKGHRVFYMSNNFVDSTEPGFRIDPLDDEGRLFQIHLNLEAAPAIYYDVATQRQTEQLRLSLAMLLGWTCTTASLSLVQHPYWSPLIRAVPNARVVYDCMDHHAGFLDNAPSILEAEEALVCNSDLVIVTSEWLETEVSSRAHATALIRNAGEYEFFRRRPERVFRDENGRRVIGYYGAIADWFDVDLVRAVAQAFPDALVLLVGDDTAGVGEQLAGLQNVLLVGEVPYVDLPYWLHGFDLCLLPFKVIPLTLATNPVKVYEYLAAGKAVVSVDLPELRQFGNLVRIATDAEGFIGQIRESMLSEPNIERARTRQLFASHQTWGDRAVAFDEAISSLKEPRVSVVVLTYNNLAFTEACLFSIEAYSDYKNLEVIVVDNASTDGSREWLQQWVETQSAAGHVRRLILNDTNVGFSAGNNVGLRAATGEYLVILNNDTYVTPGWVRTLCAHLRTDSEVGLVGPVTNNIGNEARIEIHYADMAEMIARAGEYTRRHPGVKYPMRTAAFFCVAFSRITFERVGEMDESFGVGFFEDDDYCRRVSSAGLRVLCAEDVFVHHHLSASFEKLHSAERQALFERNKAIYEAKWGPWEPHQYRDTPSIEHG